MSMTGQLSRRLRYQLYRSPFAPAIKAYRRFGARAGVAKRAALRDTLKVRSEAAAAAAALNRDGYVVLTDLIDTAARERLAAAAAERQAAGQQGNSQAAANFTNKTFWTRLLDADIQDGKMRADSPFVQFALEPVLLEVIAEATRQLPQLDYVLLTQSHYVDAPLSTSQLWHRDHDDTRTIKVFAYLTDVDELGDGPFTFLPGPFSDRFGYSLKSHRPDDAIFAHVPQDAKVEMIAKRLSVFAVETSRCLHMGSRLSEGHQRLLYTATYTTFPRLQPGTGSFVLTGQESELERAVLQPLG